jgi:hypothetical protein
MAALLGRPVFNLPCETRLRRYCDRPGAIRLFPHRALTYSWWRSPLRQASLEPVEVVSDSGRRVRTCWGGDGCR